MKLFEVENYADVKKEWFIGDDGKLVIKKTQDVQPVLDLNKQDAVSKGRFDESRRKSNLWHTHSIPLVIWMQMEKDNEYRLNGKPLWDESNSHILKQVLADPQYAYLKTM